MVSVRQYQSSDELALVALWQAVFPNDPPHNAPDKVIREKRLVDDLIFIAEQINEKGQAKIVGACMAGYDGHRGWLYAVAVSADHRREGIGKQLITHSVSMLKKSGCRKINLQIRADNTEVASFYRSLGFEVEQRMSMGMLL